MKFFAKMKNYRQWVQFGFILLYNFPFFTFKYCPVPGLNCYACPWAVGACPIGSLQHFMVIKRIPFLLLGFFLLIGGAVGRLVCGWACPGGWLQDQTYKIPAPKLKINYQPLTYSKYFVLVFLVLLIPYFTNEPWFSKLCFMGTLQGGIPLALSDQWIRQLIGLQFYLKLLLTIGVVVSFIFIRRGFCRFICPLGAIYSLFNKISFLNLKVEGGCTACNQCEKVCPMEIKVYEDANAKECIRCLACTKCAHVKVKWGKNKEGKQDEKNYNNNGVFNGN